MKIRRPVTLLFFGIGVVICIGVVFLGSIILKTVFFKNHETGQHYSTPYYEVFFPGTWNYEIAGDVDTTIVSINEEKAGMITVYPQSSFGDSVSSIVANIYGMHAYLKEEFLVKNNISDLKYCIVVGYEASAAQQINGELVEPDELHYIYISDDKTIIDFWIEYSLTNDEVIDVMESIKLLE